MCIYSKEDYIVFANAIVTTVMVNYTKLFGSSLCIPTIDIMVLDDNIMFIGALMLRMSKICSVNAKPVSIIKQKINTIMNTQFKYI